MNIIFINVFKKNFLVSRDVANLLSSVLTLVGSSTNNVSVVLTFPKVPMKINIDRENVTVEIGKEKYFSKVYLPYYIYLKKDEEFLETNEMFNVKLVLVKINDKIEVLKMI